MWPFLLLIGTAVLFYVLGWRWSSTVVRPVLKERPLVSIIIASWKAGGALEPTLKGAKSLRWPRKDIIVVNDSLQDAPLVKSICRKYGARLFQQKKRLGKAVALNLGVSKAKGELLFFLDADTVPKQDCLERLVPWIQVDGVGAVSPRFVPKPGKGMLAGFQKIENSFNATFFKIQMFFGSLIAFRGCGVLVRKSVLKSVGGWFNTLVEDNELAIRILKKKWSIQYEPDAVVKTTEPSSFKELGRQRFRWGKGSIYNLGHHPKSYSRTPQFIIQIYVYVFLFVGLLLFVAWQSIVVFLIPFLASAILYAMSLQEIVVMMSVISLPVLYTILATIAGAMAHLAILSAPGTSPRRLALVILYIFIYLPFLTYWYWRGLWSGIKDKKAKKPELDFRDW